MINKPWDCWLHPVASCCLPLPSAYRTWRRDLQPELRQGWSTGTDACRTECANQKKSKHLRKSVRLRGWPQQGWKRCYVGSVQLISQGETGQSNWRNIRNWKLGEKHPARWNRGPNKCKKRLHVLIAIAWILHCNLISSCHGPTRMLHLKQINGSPVEFVDKGCAGSSAHIRDIKDLFGPSMAFLKVFLNRILQASLGKFCLGASLCYENVGGVNIPPPHPTNQKKYRHGLPNKNADLRKMPRILQARCLSLCGYQDLGTCKSSLDTGDPCEPKLGVASLWVGSS